MKKVLVIASHFPPNATGGVIRIAKLTKYFGQFGWQSVVVTSSATVQTEELKSDVKNVASVYRFSAFDIRKLFFMAKSAVVFVKALISKLNKGHIKKEAAITNQKKTGRTQSSLAHRFVIPDYMIFWVPLAILGGVYAAKKHKVSVILSTSPLPSANLVAYCVSKLARLPWVLDMRDPWTTNPIGEKRGHPCLERFDRFLESKALKSADHVVVVSSYFIPPIIEAFPFIPQDKFSVVTNGYDPDDFVNLKEKKFDKYTIAHCGSFYQDRSAIPFLEALRKLLDANPTYVQHLQVMLVGDAGIEAQLKARELGLLHVVKFVGIVPHTESLSFIAGADLLLLVPGPGKSTMTGKVFEYLAVQKPILALVGEGGLKEMLEEYDIGQVVDPNDVESIKNAILSKYESRTSPTEGNFTQIENNYSRKEIARRIAFIMDSVSK